MNLLLTSSKKIVSTDKAQEVNHSNYSKSFLCGYYRLHLSKSGNAREFLALQKLEGGTAAGTDVADLVSQTGLVDGGHGVSSANDCRGASLGGLGQ